MDGLGSVQNKVSCVFETMVLDEQSGKRENQSYKVVASERMKQRAIDNDVHTALVTEKLDGTCVYIAEFEGKPWLWARYDRKPTKGAEKRFKKFQYQKQRLERERGSGDGSVKTSSFKWDMMKDFKDTPEYWIPASGVQVVDGSPVPDDIGHTPGWVPISPLSRQHCWHLSAIDLNLSLALVLRERDESGDLCIECMHMSDLEGHTAELIGTNINGNPYGIGSKKFPIHFLVIHGSIRIRNPPEIKMDIIKEWFKNEGQIEGIVWHCANGTLFKLHRNHVALPWPVQAPTLTLRPVTVTVDMSRYELDNNDSLLAQFGKVQHHTCGSLKDLENLFHHEQCEENIANSQKTGSQLCNGDQILVS